VYDMREPFKLRGIGIRIGLPHQLLQVLAHKLVHACAHGLGAAPRFLDHFVIDG
jgi:hypothetical protein